MIDSTSLVEPLVYEQPCGDYPIRQYIEVYRQGGDLLGHLDVSKVNYFSGPTLIVSYINLLGQLDAGEDRSPLCQVEFYKIRLIRDSGWTDYWALQTTANVEELSHIGWFRPYADFARSDIYDRTADRKRRVWDAVRFADKEYDGAHPSSQRISRPEHIGRAVISQFYH